MIKVKSVILEIDGRETTVTPDEAEAVVKALKRMFDLEEEEEIEMPKMVAITQEELEHQRRMQEQMQRAIYEQDRRERYGSISGAPCESDSSLHSRLNKLGVF